MPGRRFSIVARSAEGRAGQPFAIADSSLLPLDAASGWSRSYRHSKTGASALRLIPHGEINGIPYYVIPLGKEQEESPGRNQPLRNLSHQTLDQIR